jgi:predicted HicB family RNase H-like nuclease
LGGKDKSKRDPLPESFKAIDEFTKFWDTHDTEDYPEAWRQVPVTVSMKTRRYPRIVLEPNVARQLDKRARAQGISMNALVNQLLRDSLRHSVR